MTEIALAILAVCGVACLVLIYLGEDEDDDIGGGSW